MKISTDNKKIQELLSRGRENIYPNKEFLEKELKSGRQLKLYTGYDPTGDTLHIGHGITLMKLKQFQDLGHKIIMLIGDFTGMIGDPTDKSSARQQLTKEQVLQNYKNYKKQASAILNFEGGNPVEVRYNNDWLGKMTFKDVVELSSHFTVQQMLQRDMFEKRFYGETWCSECVEYFTNKGHRAFTPNNTRHDEGTIGISYKHPLECPCCGNVRSATVGQRDFHIQTKPIYLHEFLYPLMQGYDTVAMDVDGEVGGNDQTFNMLAGRTLMKAMKNKEKFVVTMKLLADDSGKKMGKTEGNMIALKDDANEMFGKVMSWSDGLILQGFELCTAVEDEEIKLMKKEMEAGANPRDFKIKLAKEIVKIYHSEDEANKAEQGFIDQFQKGKVPEDIPEFELSGKMNIVELLTKTKLVTSKSEARRMIDQNAVSIDGEKINDIEKKVELKNGMVVQKGKRGFARIINK